MAPFDLPGPPVEIAVISIPYHDSLGQDHICNPIPCLVRPMARAWQLHVPSEMSEMP